MGNNELAKVDDYTKVNKKKAFDIDAITDFLLGESREILRQSWGLSKEDFKELFFELYFCLLKKYAKCGIFKKVFLIFVGLWKFFIGRKLK